MRQRRLVILAIVVLAGCAWMLARARCAGAVKTKVESAKPPPKTVEERVAEFGPAVDARLAPVFRGKGVGYPPKRIALLGFKSEKTLEIYAADDAAGEMKFIRAYPVLAASGTTGPKLREGDEQVPEGFYRIESLNPNSRFHLALRVDYPNDSDRARASAENRRRLGGDIMIHGNRVSIGCLAMGDEAAEDLFVLAAKIGIENIRLILSPVDFRSGDLPPADKPLPAWTDDLYREIKAELGKFKRE
jgi:L,D-transpeptidase-like protein